MSHPLVGKKVVLGVSGGIAAYKAVELSRLLVKEGVEVYVVMTENAKQFVTPLTFEALSGHPVYHEIFGSQASASMEHIRAAEKADLMIVAPATANSIGKMTHGLADDPLSTLFSAFAGPVLVAPAMNDKMWGNPAIQENIRTLKKRGVGIIDPEAGELACGTVGLGRLAEPDRLLEAVRKCLLRQTDLAGLRVLVTAGPTREPLDPVRFITNRSSGKMGYAIARQAQSRGAEVTLVSGPTHLEPPFGVSLLNCQRAGEMAQLVLDH
jgi:phosphopantothenoylcysteine decarboxylase/phosphopantothenate--cysteine ligase